MEARYRGRFWNKGFEKGWQDLPPKVHAHEDERLVRAQPILHDVHKTYHTANTCQTTRTKHRGDLHPLAHLHLQITRQGQRNHKDNHIRQHGYDRVGQDQRPLVKTLPVQRGVPELRDWPADRGFETEHRDVVGGEAGEDDPEDDFGALDGAEDAGEEDED